MPTRRTHTFCTNPVSWAVKAISGDDTIYQMPVMSLCTTRILVPGRVSVGMCNTVPMGGRVVVDDVPDLLPRFGVEHDVVDTAH